MSAHTKKQKHVIIHIYIHLYMCIYIYIHIYIHTYTYIALVCRVKSLLDHDERNLENIYGIFSKSWEGTPSETHRFKGSFRLRLGFEKDSHGVSEGFPEGGRPIPRAPFRLVQSC